ncbi:hypothetical protein [Phyllobacterium zundukense]|uniref:Uncharacterized protein n=1 Tax=Phyllobacterium zundukense TaxID=1867719 RepID=A0ACD4D3E8_9HYPH|nr:hypothetical protein [Phyllobacterium zundukense]UXN60386.1 hypothetical protein N8E88_28455 [Phyllobacterium zundukense]
MNYRHLVVCSAAVFSLHIVPGLAQEAKQPEATTPAPAETPVPKEQAATATQTPPEYLDDRSNPEALIKSYYNAINRQEYARAYSYYASDSPPQPFPQFQAGYETTASVSVLFGKAVGEGAAGSAYWSQPMAIKSEGKDGSVTVFNGCYRLRLANPAIQGVPYVPLSILDGTLQKSDQPFEESVPEGCEAP